MPSPRRPRALEAASRLEVDPTNLAPESQQGRLRLLPEAQPVGRLPGEASDGPHPEAGDDRVVPPPRAAGQGAPHLRDPFPERDLELLGGWLPRRGRGDPAELLPAGPCEDRCARPGAGGHAHPDPDDGPVREATAFLQPDVSGQHDLEPPERGCGIGGHTQLGCGPPGREVDQASLQGQEVQVAEAIEVGVVGDDGRRGRRHHDGVDRVAVAGPQDPEVVGDRAHPPEGGCDRRSPATAPARAEVLGLQVVRRRTGQRPGHGLDPTEVHGRPSAHPPHDRPGFDQVGREHGEVVEQPSEGLLDQVAADAPHQGWQHARQHLADPGGREVEAGEDIRRVVVPVAVLGLGDRDGPSLHDPDRRAVPRPLDVLGPVRTMLDLHREVQGGHDLERDVSGRSPIGPGRGTTATSGVVRPDTSDSPRPATHSTRASVPSPAGSIVNTTPARSAGTICISTAAIAACSSAMPKLAR